MGNIAIVSPLICPALSLHFFTSSLPLHSALHLMIKTLKPITEWYTTLVQKFHNIRQQTVSAWLAGWDNSANRCLYMQSYSDPFLFCKPAICSLHPNIIIYCSFQISTLKSMQNWSDSVCKPVISILNLARRSLQTSDLHSSSSIYSCSCSFWISTKQCTHHSSPVIPYSAALISKLFSSSEALSLVSYHISKSIQQAPPLLHVLSCLREHLSN